MVMTCFIFINFTSIGVLSKHFIYNLNSNLQVILSCAIILFRYIQLETETYGNADEIKFLQLNLFIFIFLYCVYIYPVVW